MGVCPPTPLGGTTDAGLPTASNVEAVTEERDATTLADRAVVPRSPPATVPPWANGEEFGEPPLALMTTMVAMTATTSRTGTSAVNTGWRRRKVRGVAGSDADRRTDLDGLDAPWD
jgi:hypothetical protein